MAVRKITLVADRNGNIAGGSGIADGCIFIYTGETLQINFVIENQDGTCIPADTKGYYDAAVVRDSDGAVLAGTSGADRQLAEVGSDGSLPVMLETGTGAMAETAAAGMESCSLQIIHYPAGSLYGEIILKVPVLLEPAYFYSHICCCSESHAEIQLPDRSAPALEAFTGGGWRINAGKEGTAWRWRFPDGTITPVLPLRIPATGYDTAGKYAERDVLTAGENQCDFLAEDINMLFLKRDGKWSNGVQWQGKPGADAEDVVIDSLFLPFERKNGGINYDLAGKVLSSATVLPVPHCMDIEVVCSGNCELALSLRNASGNVYGQDSFVLSPGNNLLQLVIPEAESFVPDVLLLECSLPDTAGNNVHVTAGSILCSFRNGNVPLPDCWTLLLRINSSAVAGRVYRNGWQWNGETLEAVGIVDGSGFFTASPGQNWGVETGIDMRTFAPSWSICGRFSIEHSTGKFTKVLFRAGDPAGGNRCCIAGCTAEYDGEGTGRIIFRVNCCGCIQETAVGLPDEKFFAPLTITAVFDERHRKAGVIVHGAGEDWRQLPEYPFIPHNISGTAHPLLEIGCLHPDRNVYSSSGCGVSSFFVSDHPLTSGEAAFVARLLPVSIDKK